MIDSFSDKIKNVIDGTILLRFDIIDMEYSSYLPLLEKDGAVFIIVKEKTDKIAVKSTISVVLKNDKIKFKQISDTDFDELLDYVKKKFGCNLHDNKTSKESANNIRTDVNGNELNNDIQSSEGIKTKDKFLSKKLGEILTQMGFLTQDQLVNALVDSKKDELPLGTFLIQRGIITIDQLKEALSAQQGYDTVSSSDLKVSEDVINKLPEDFIILNKVLPLSYTEDGFVVGMVNPNDKRVFNQIISFTGLKPVVRIITYYEFTMCIKNLFDERRKAANKLSRKIVKENASIKQEVSILEQAQEDLKNDSSMVVQFANQIIFNGIDLGVSDIHIEPRLEKYIVRYRKDGILREVMQLPTRSEGAILTRFKIISKMNIAEHRRPQDGSFSLSYNDRDYDFRINTLPVGSGEKMVIRILAPAVSLSSTKSELNLVGASKKDISIIKKMESSPNGIILATGPTGSGKTTTLYTLLNAINEEGINITTIEDPVEIKIEGINQSQINAKAGITFASCMRAILRQDPDVILVGEIRDLETLETAISAALTGHLVLSTLHTNSAASTITRLVDMGAKDYLVSSTLVGIVAQRLVRGLCPSCKVAVQPTREEAELVVSGGEKEIQEFMQTTIYKAGKCDKCNFEGYKGRLGIYEVMPITKEIKKLISKGAHDIEIEDAAVGAGMLTLQQACLKHILDGNTTISEFLRVLGPVRE